MSKLWFHTVKGCVNTRLFLLGWVPGFFSARDVLMLTLVSSAVNTFSLLVNEICYAELKNTTGCEK